MKGVGRQEAVLASTRRHGSVLVLPALLLIAGCFVTGLLLAGTDGWRRTAVLVVALAVALRGCLVPYLRWWRRRVVVTERRVLLTAGVVGPRSTSVPLEAVEDVQVRWTLRDRLLRRTGLLLVLDDGSALDLGALGDPDAVLDALDA